MRVWGWAGWRRSFEGYDPNLKNLKEKNTWKSIIFNHTDVLMKKYFKSKIIILSCNLVPYFHSLLIKMLI
jgi:hypothetical protein